MKNLIKIFEVEELPKTEETNNTEPNDADESMSKSPQKAKIAFSKKFIDDVYLNLYNIKNVAFEYACKIWEMSNQKVESILASRDYEYIMMNPCNVAKIIINRTNDPKLITSVHGYIVSIRNSQLFAITTENIIEIDKMLDDKRRQEGIIQWKGRSTT